MKVLFICTQPPLHPMSGSPLRTRGLMHLAGKIAEIGIVALARTPAEELAAEGLRTSCSYVATARHFPGGLRRAVVKVAAVVKASPFYLEESRCRSMDRAVRDAIARWQPDIVQAECMGSAFYMGAAVRAGIPVVYSAHNVESAVVAGSQAAAERLARRPFAAKTGRFEGEIAQRADAVIAVTRGEESWFAERGARTACVPNSVFPGEYSFRKPSESDGRTILFAGHLSYPPNRHAVDILVRDIFPGIKKILPEVRLLIAGRTPDRRILRLAGKDIEVIGDVKDMRALFRKAVMMICPLAWGGGSRVKLLEAAASGAVIVATPKAAEGLMLRAGEECAIAGDPSRLASAAVELLREPARADAMAAAARRAVERYHDWSLYGDALANLYESLSPDLPVRRGEEGVPP